jgi:hypothetical protein
MSEFMTRSGIHWVVIGLSITVGACDVVETSTAEQAGENLQGENLQGENLQGENLQGMSMQGIRLTGATLSGVALTRVQIDRGELVAQRGSDTLRGTQLVGARFRADVRGTAPPASAVIEYRIAAIEPELGRYDLTRSGHTFLYTLEQWASDTGTWQTACPADADNRNVAIPVAAVWNEHGDRKESTTQFTFGCTTGVIAKCYRWGYRPWVSGYGDLVAMHQTCTRLARADYCGNGRPNTHDGTKVNVWDTLPPPGPIQRHGVLPPIGFPPVPMTFEAGWNTGGAVCLSRARWLLDDSIEIASLCPDRLVPPGLGQTVCDSIADALGYDANAKMFNESYLNVKL